MDKKVNIAGHTSATVTTGRSGGPLAPYDEARTADAFRALIDEALANGGSYYLTYHRYARRDQVLAAYPQFPDFLAAKKRLDPEERFQSDWYRHYRALLAP